MKIKRLFVILSVLLGFHVYPAIATLIEVSVETDKLSYELTETPTVYVIAYNPNNYEITLEYSSTYQADHIIDGTYIWSEGMVFLPVFTSVSIEPFGSHTWTQSHYSAPDLGLGWHTVVGTTYGVTSSPASFEVVPEPATVCLLGLGGLALRRCSGQALRRKRRAKYL